MPASLSCGPVRRVRCVCVYCLLLHLSLLRSQRLSLRSVCVLLLVCVCYLKSEGRRRSPLFQVSRTRWQFGFGDSRRSLSLRGLLMVTPTDSRTPRAPLQHVIFFTHIPKAAGTTVRGIFFKECCAGANHTSRTWQSVAGWNSRPEQIAYSLQRALTNGEPRIFVEHHSHLDFSLPKRMRLFVYRHNREVRFTSFTIWREPVSLAASNWAYWMRHTYTLEDFLSSAPEWMLFGSISGCDNSSATPIGLLRSRLDKAEPSDATACTRPPLSGLCNSLAAHPRSPSQWCGWDAVQRRAWAARVVAHTARVLRTVARRGCSALARDAFAQLTGVGQVLLLEDNRTIPRVQALAAAASHPSTANWSRPKLSAGWLHRQSSGLTPLSDPAARKLARERNECSIHLDALVRSRLRPSGGLAAL